VLLVMVEDLTVRAAAEVSPDLVAVVDALTHRVVPGQHGYGHAYNLGCFR